MAGFGSISTPTADHVERVQEVSTTAALVDRLTAEGFISMQAAARVYGRRTHKSTVTRHALKGVKLTDGTLLRLEAIRVSGSLVTSFAAVKRFIVAQNQTTITDLPFAGTPTPSARGRATANASKKLDELLGSKE